MNKIVNILKPTGMTSHDVVSRVRRILNMKKVGHTGTLDPDAAGVLPICLNKATKVSELILNKEKTYICELTLGASTDTYDSSGVITFEGDASNITKEDIYKAFETQRGEINQYPPIYSALKVNGKKLYELAREGKVVERKSRKVQIYDIRIKEMKLPRIRMEVSCSKGTYIRTLCNDVGEVLGVGGCMESLLRTKVSRFELKDSMKLADIEKAKNEGRTEEIILPLDEVFVEYPKIIVTGRQAQLAYNGNPFPKESAKNLILPGKDGGEDDLSDIFSRYKKYRVYDEQGRFIAIYSYQKQRQLFRIEKMFFDPDGK